MSILNHFGHIILTEDQGKTALALQDFLVDDSNIFLLNGYAGSGKTTILKGVWNIMVLLTNRQKIKIISIRMLSQSLHWEKMIFC